MTGPSRSSPRKRSRGPAGSLNQNGAVTVGDLWEKIEELGDGGALADNVGKGVFFEQLLAQLLDLPEVLEGFHSADHLALAAAQDCG